MKTKYIVIGIIVAFSACMAEQDNPLVAGLNPTCDDGIKNQNEVGVDCGGKCNACKAPVITPCAASLSNNELILNGIKTPLTGSRSFYCTLKHDFYEIYISLTLSQEIRIKLGTKMLPSKDGIYPIAWEYDMENGESSITMINFYRYSANQGQVYVHVTNGNIMVEMCNIVLYGSGSQATLSGRIICS